MDRSQSESSTSDARSQQFENDNSESTSCSDFSDSQSVSSASTLRPISPEPSTSTDTKWRQLEPLNLPSTSTHPPSSSFSGEDLLFNGEFLESDSPTFAKHTENAIKIDETKEGNQLNSEGEEIEKAEFLPAKTDFTFPIYANLPQTPSYNTGDEKEDRRLNEIHNIACEFLSKIMIFVNYLTILVETYPKFLAEKGLELRPAQNGQKNIVLFIGQSLASLLAAHRAILEELKPVYEKFNAREPEFCSVLKKYVHCFKFTLDAALRQDELMEKLQEYLTENRDIAEATLQFEAMVESWTERNLVREMTRIHTSLFHNKFVMNRYVESLPEESKERGIAEDTLAEFDKLLDYINYSFCRPSDVEKIRMMFEGHFEATAAGRKLIYHSEARRHTSNGLKKRYLVLFSDVLWVCSLKNCEKLEIDFKKCYQLPTSNLQIKETLEKNCLEILSSIKSSRYLFDKKEIKERWWKALNTAIDMANEVKKRRTLALALDGPRREEPGTSTSEMAHLKGLEEVDPVEPTWLPDSTSNRCLMEQCLSEFTLVNRRHHCRRCGWLICTKCMGKAPVPVLNFEQQPVCPPCHEDLFGIYGADPSMTEFFTPPKKLGFRKFEFIDKKTASIQYGKVLIKDCQATTARKACAVLTKTSLMFFKTSKDLAPFFMLSLKDVTIKQIESDGSFVLYSKDEKKKQKLPLVRFRAKKSEDVENWLNSFRSLASTPKSS